MSAVSLTIDGRTIEVAPGTTILEASRQLGLDIPTLCHDPELAPNGACRICVVEVEKARTLVASCVTPAAGGMVVRTESERVVEARRSILSLLVANHPLDCITCEKTGTCKLQDYCYRYRVCESEYAGQVKQLEVEDGGSFFIRDMNKCILCGICVGKCQDVVGAGAIDFTGRGFVTNVAPPFDDRIEDSTCVFCGLCIESCPVGALVPRAGVGRGRPWQVERVKTICPYCSVGCGVELQVRDGAPVGASPERFSPVNRGQLCARGMFGWDFMNSSERLTVPLVKKGRVFVEAGWDEALGLAAEKMAEVIGRHGAEALMGLCSPKLSNEECYLFQKLFRSLGSNSVDCHFRHTSAPALESLAAALGGAATTNSFGELAAAEAILLVGADPDRSHPVIGYRIREALLKGAKLIAAHSEPIGISAGAEIYLPCPGGAEQALLEALALVVLEEGLFDREFIEKQSEGFDAYRESLSGFCAAEAAASIGLKEEDLRSAARVYAGAGSAALVTAPDAGAVSCGPGFGAALANLALLTGSIGREGAGIFVLHAENNQQGSADMGILPDSLPGGQLLAAPAVRDKFSRAWNAALGGRAGFSALDLVGAGGSGPGIQAVLVAGENPAACARRGADYGAALGRLDLLVVTDSFMSETASLASVILPAAVYAEKEGTYTNAERRVQLSGKALHPPGEARSDLWIITALANLLGLNWGPAGPGSVFDEIAALTPSYAGMSYRRLKEMGLQWPCPHPGHPGTGILQGGRFTLSGGLPEPSPAGGGESLSAAMARRSVVGLMGLR